MENIETAIAHHRAGRLADAEAIYRGLLAENPQDAAALQLLGLIACQTGDLQGAVELVGQAAEIEPGNAEFLTNLGEIHRRRREFTPAIQSHQRALALDPKNADLHYNLAMALTGANRLPEAIAAYRQCLALKPDHTEALNNLGLILRQSGELRSAAECFGQAVAQKPGHVEARNNLGLTLWEMGEHERAVAEFRAAVDGLPQVPLAHANLIFALRRMGRAAEALSAAKKAAEANPNSGELCQSLAMALLEAGNISDAVEAARRGAEISPLNAGAHHVLAVTLSAAAKSDPGRKAAALEAYDQALKIKPSSAWQFERSALAGKQVRTAPESYVKNLFDEYALRFESHLVNELHYRVPEHLLRAMVRIQAAPVAGWSVLDLGCGTGRCGELFRPHAAKITGVDLSPKMIAAARARGDGKVYDELLSANILAGLRRFEETFDVVIAAGVFIYVGALDEIFPAAFEAMKRGGLFAFSVENHDGEGFVLHKERRFAHSLLYIRTFARMAGFVEVLAERCELRNDVPPGWIVVLRKPA